MIPLLQDEAAQKDCSIFFSPFVNVLGLNSYPVLPPPKSTENRVPISVTSETQYYSYLDAKNYFNTYAVVNVSRRPVHVIILIDMGIKPTPKKRNRDAKYSKKPANFS